MKLGIKHMQLMNIWTRSAATFGAAAFTALIYFSEWRVVTDNIPLYNTKYKKEE